ncbi:ABC transporter permease [Halorubrum sp. DTA98]|uniref:ABC transporter permease n=1 Tax=Halorubrum sp. DTA98 TaxID=3402163 RepID=UPI003AAAD2F3
MARFEARRQFKQMVGVAGGMFGFVVLVVLIFPSIEAAGADFEEYMEALPDALMAAFGGEAVPITTIEGFLVLEVYGLIWTLLVGAYLAYAAATLIAGEREQGTIDILLMTPLPRRRIVAEKFLSMVPDVVFVSLATYLGVVVGAALIDEAVDLYWLAVLHVVSIPYLLACVSFGLLLSVVVESARRAQILAFAGIAVMYMLEALTRETEYDRLGDVMFPRYFDPAAILVRNEVEALDALLLVAAALVFLLLAAALFERADIAT